MLRLLPAHSSGGLEYIFPFELDRCEDMPLNVNDSNLEVGESCHFQNYSRNVKLGSRTICSDIFLHEMYITVWENTSI